jgi:four helix bundle protein
MQPGNHKDLVVWQKAMDAVVEVYRLTETFPGKEQFGLVSQMRRSAVSIPSNIAEGRRRQTDADYRHFLSMAFGSGAELETQIEISKRVGYLKESAAVEAILTEVMKMLNKMIDNLRL